MGEEAKEELMSRIAGEIILAQSPGKAMRKWRTLFELTQAEVARFMRISPSVLSDYENDRRRSPGTSFIRKFVRALIKADELKGGSHIEKYAIFYRNLSSAVIDLDEFETPKTIDEIVSAIDGEILAGESLLNVQVYGYTVIDSLKAIMTLDLYDFLYLLGRNPMRAVIFTKVSRGRSPIVAAKLYPVKPRMIVIHGPKNRRQVDGFAIELARLENLCFVLCRLESVSDIVSRLRSLKKS
ncbi:MAG: helix-turn-helix domain-containing protein [Thaumarchaeota archaeon]|nr:helix-turn-helix domain-containing protein [Nitrososphaerota archaeon]